MNTHILSTKIHQMCQVFFLSLPLSLFSLPLCIFLFFSFFFHISFLLSFFFLFLNHLRVHCRHDTSILIFQYVSLKDKESLFLNITTLPPSHLETNNIRTSFLYFSVQTCKQYIKDWQGISVDEDKGFTNKKCYFTDFPGGPVVKTLYFHCRGMGSIPGPVTKLPHTAHHGKKIKGK